MYSNYYLEILELDFEFVDRVGQLVDHLDLRCIVPIVHAFLGVNPIHKKEKYSK